MTDTILKEFADLPDGPLHYTIDKLFYSNSFIVNVRDATKDVTEVWTSLIPMSKIHIVLKYFGDAGYIADRIAF